MSLWMFVKTFGDLCLYFSVISAFPKLFSYDFTFLWPCLLCSLAVGIADALSTLDKPTLRHLTLVLPLAGFLLAETFMEYLILLLPVTYAAVLVIRDRNYLEYYGFRNFLKTSITVWTLYFLVICLLWYFENATQPWRVTMNFKIPLVCGLLYMLSGVLLLRQLRMGTDGKQSALNGAQMAGILGATGAVILGVACTERFLQCYAAAVLDVLKKAALYIVTAPLVMVTQMISSVLSGRFEILEEPTKEQIQYTEPPVEGGFPPPVLGTVEQTTEESVFPWWLVVLILVAMAAILAVMAKAYSKRRTAICADEIRGTAEPHNKGRDSRERSNRSKLRQIYRSFLKQQRGRGLRLYPYYTSEDVQVRLGGDTDKNAAAELRQLYLRARYDLVGEITSEDLKKAKETMKQIRNGKEIDR